MADQSFQILADLSNRKVRMILDGNGSAVWFTPERALEVAVMLTQAARSMLPDWRVAVYICEVCGGYLKIASDGEHIVVNTCTKCGREKRTDTTKIDAEIAEEVENMKRAGVLRL